MVDCVNIKYLYVITRKLYSGLKIGILVIFKNESLWVNNLKFVSGCLLYNLVCRRKLLKK